MARRIVIADFRVLRVTRRDGRHEYTIVQADGTVHVLADRFLRSCGGGTNRTYAYLLVDHLRWLESEALDIAALNLFDVQRYMGAVGAEFAGPRGRPWRTDKRPYMPSTLQTAAACLKRFYVYLGVLGVNSDLAGELSVRRLPTAADRRRMMLGHNVSEVPANPIRKTRSVQRRHPKLPPDGARQKLLETVGSARDRMVVTWLADGGLRIGELCGLHLVDLHLREDAPCGECRSPHVHICHREGNRNGARVKVKHSWVFRGDCIRGGQIRRVSPSMIHTYYDYLTSEYPTGVDHGLLLVQLKGSRMGEPWSASAARGMLRRASKRGDIDIVRPHAFRHLFATRMLEATNGNVVMARDAGGWASAATVEQVYGHLDVHDAAFSAALTHVWGQPR